MATALVAALISAASPAVALAAPAAVVADAGPCDPNANQTDLTACWAGQAQQAQDALDATYARVVPGLDKLGADAMPLDAIQAAWLKTRDATCAFEKSLTEGGTISPMMGWQCLDRMTRARTARLQAVLAAFQSDGAAPPPQRLSPSVDAELNRVYGLLQKLLTTTQRNALTQSEVLWLTYRDKACHFEGGNCLTDLEQERINELEAGWIGEKFW